MKIPTEKKNGIMINLMNLQVGFFFFCNALLFQWSVQWNSHILMSYMKILLTNIKKVASMDYEKDPLYKAIK